MAHRNITRHVSMVNPNTLLLASTFELVGEWTWLASLYDDAKDEQRAFLLFVTPGRGRKYSITYAEVDPEDCHRAPVFLQEIFHTSVWAAEDQVLPLLEQVKATILQTSLVNPKTLPFQFGGLYRHESPSPKVSAEYAS